MKNSIKSIPAGEEKISEVIQAVQFALREVYLNAKIPHWISEAIECIIQYSPDPGFTIKRLRTERKIR